VRLSFGDRLSYLEAMFWLASLSILLTADGEGASGRQFVPFMPNLPEVQLSQTGFSAATRGGRACYADDLEAFHKALKTKLKRTSTRAVWALKTPVSWMVADQQSDRLPDRLAIESRWMAATEERWSASAGNPVTCVVLNADGSAQEQILDEQLKGWEIRWLGKGQVEGVGSVVEIARPIGDGARRYFQLDQLRRADPMRLWLSLGNLLEGWSWVRDGPNLHRTTTIMGLEGKGPEFMVLGTNDSVVGWDQLTQDLSAMGTQVIDSLGEKAPVERQGVVIPRGNQRIAFFGIHNRSKQLPSAQREARITAIFDRLAKDGPIHRAILLARHPASAAPFLDDSRFQVVVLPAGLNLAPRQGEFKLPLRREAIRNGQSPVLIRVPSNAIMQLTIKASSASLEAHKIDERVPANEQLAQRVNTVRHELYPTLSKPLISAPRKGRFDSEKTLDLVAGVILRAGEADAVVLPPFMRFLSLPGGLSRLDLLERLAMPSPLVSMTVDGGALKTLLAAQSLQWRSREKLEPGRPLRLVTTAEVADLLKPKIGARDRRWVSMEDQRLRPHKDGRASLPRSVLPWLEHHTKDGNNSIDELLEMPPARQRLVLRIDRLQLSALGNDLRAPTGRRTAEDPRTNQPSRTSLGGHLDLRLIQPLSSWTVSLRTLAAYTRDLFPEDGATATLDKESIDDWSLTAELMRSNGPIRPFANGVWDSEFTAGDPNDETQSPRQVRLELNAGLAIPKSGPLHEARLAVTSSQDLSRILAETDPTPNLAIPGWRFAISGLTDWRRKVAGLEARLVVDGRYYLPENEPLPSTLLWAIGERLEIAIPFAGGLSAAVVMAHTVWQTHDEDDPASFGDHQLTAGFSLAFKRVMRPLAGIF